MTNDEARHALPPALSPISHLQEPRRCTAQAVEAAQVPARRHRRGALFLLLLLPPSLQHVLQSRRGGFGGSTGGLGALRIARRPALAGAGFAGVVSAQAAHRPG